MMSKQSRQNAASVDIATAKIVIDEDQGLVFASEEDLYQHFFNEISILESEFFRLRHAERDIPEDAFENFEKNLSATLEKPDEIWEDKNSVPGKTLMIYLKEFPDQANSSSEIEEKEEQFLF
ncbi:MAG: hypothetical protein KDD35_10825, partial [Bdellovibrionales bacterium]|nr:hypothetical protein [Bdellovibrionales bacterium]